MKKYQVVQAKLIKAVNLTGSIYDFTVESEYLAKASRCGQFIHIDCGEQFVLRRPISICEVLDNGIRFIFDVRGKGTGKLSEKQAGDTLDILGPLGNGFHIRKDKALVLGGGIGVYPLLELVKQLDSCDVSLGFRTKDLITLQEEFQTKCNTLTIATDDGTYGFYGNALAAVKEKLESGAYESVYACGPLPMLKALKQITDKYNIFCQISMEERMGCGIGACLCCNVKIEDDSEEGFKHLHVCKDGPVFNAKEVLL
ncbi:MAG: dihydroorotate dehydrogenase electron transfer subunit [Clostridia bacterium]|nr:dihydroorotate dehydrogenase electron transfer subunit [Clostridia bacterium]